MTTEFTQAEIDVIVKLVSYPVYGEVARANIAREILGKLGITAKVVYWEGGIHVFPLSDPRLLESEPVL